MSAERFPKREGTKVPLFDHLAGRLAGHLITKLATRAAKRKQWHEFNHCVTSLRVGSSENCGPNCAFDKAGPVDVVLAGRQP